MASSCSHCCGVTTPPGRARADHEAVGRLQLRSAAFVAEVALVLLVAAVVLDQRLVVFAQRAGDRIGQAFEQRTAQAMAFVLDVFDGMRCSSVHVPRVAALALQAAAGSSRRLRHRRRCARRSRRATRHARPCPSRSRRRRRGARRSAASRRRRGRVRAGAAARRSCPRDRARTPGRGAAAVPISARAAIRAGTGSRCGNADCRRTASCGRRRRSRRAPARSRGTARRRCRGRS